MYLGGNDCLASFVNRDVLCGDDRVSCSPGAGNTLQREFHLARKNAVHVHQVPELSVSSFLSASSDLPGILHALAAARHLLEMYRRQLKDETETRTLRRLDKRLHAVALELDRLATPAK